MNSIEQVENKELLAPNGLKQEVIKTLSSELDALQEDRAAGWATRYPTLYNWILDQIKELSEVIGCNAPNLFLRFDLIQREQALIYRLPNNEVQIHIGVELIRKFVFRDQSLASYNSFKWVIAHEIGHVSDQKFKLFAANISYIQFINKIAVFAYAGAIINALSTWSLLSVKILLGILAFIGVSWLVTTMLRRHFEYVADDISMATGFFNIEDAEHALTSMTISIKKDTAEFLNSLQGAAKINQQLMIASASMIHPSIKNRIARMKKVRN